MNSNVLYCLDTRLIIVLFKNMDSGIKKKNILFGNMNSSIKK